MSYILLIEPDRILGETYVKYLVGEGHEVRRYATAQATIHAIDERRPDIILLELQLADHGGIEFLYELRSYSEWQSIPIVIQTFVPQYLFSDNKQQFENLGIAQYLYKPATTLKQLNRAINQVLEPVRA